MSQGRGQTDATTGRHMPAIHGVRARDTFADRAAAFDPDQIAADQLAEQEEDGASAATIDPWGVEDLSPAPVEDSAPPASALPRRGGGTLTIPLLCIGIAIIACVSLLPLADENRQLAWERERLKADLTQLKEQGRVNAEFLTRVADDPTLAERLAQRQMKYIREGTSILQLRGQAKEEMSPFHLVSVPPPPPQTPYEPTGGFLGTLVRQPRAQLYLCGLALLLIAAGLVLGYVPKAKPDDVE